MKKKRKKKRGICRVVTRSIKAASRSNHGSFNEQGLSVFGYVNKQSPDGILSTLHGIAWHSEFALFRGISIHASLIHTDDASVFRHPCRSSVVSLRSLAGDVNSALKNAQPPRRPIYCTVAHCSRHVTRDFVDEQQRYE